LENPATPHRLGGKTALITGASSGIGAAAARALAAEGARVALVARRVDRLTGLVNEIERAGGRALAVPTDVTDRVAVEAAVEATVQAFGSLDVLVNNAGVMLLSMLDEGRVDDWDRMIDVNIKGLLYGVNAAAPVMKDQGGGHIVNVGSVAGRRPLLSSAVYSATKFAVRCISAGIHLELSASHGIRVTDIQPGAVDTELPDHIPNAAIQAGFKERWADKRMLQSEDIAAAIVYAVTAPAHVNVNEILVRPTDQAV
jgi:NADP-dependent 3-hydroxy acid dehydrogenase YdfG